MSKIRAYDVQDLRQKLIGRKDCTILISSSCLSEIERMDCLSYLHLEKELNIRNIKLKLEEK